MSQFQSMSISIQNLELPAERKEKNLIQIFL